MDELKPGDTFSFEGVYLVNEEPVTATVIVEEISDDGETMTFTVKPATDKDAETIQSMVKPEYS